MGEEGRGARGNPCGRMRGGKGRVGVYATDPGVWKTG